MKHARKLKLEEMRNFETILANIHTQLSFLSTLVGDLAAAHEDLAAAHEHAVARAQQPGGRLLGQPCPPMPARSPSANTCDVFLNGEPRGVPIEEYPTETRGVPIEDYLTLQREKEEAALRMRNSMALGQDLLSACLEANTEKVSELLSMEADPNMELNSFTCAGKEFVSGTPLTIAVLCGFPNLVSLLAENQADVDSRYSFIAGAEQLCWTGPVSHATVPRGDLNMLKNLITWHADVKAVGSNGASLMWQAAYFDKSQILEFLIQSGCEVDQRAQSQDDSSHSHSPMHAAALAGHSNAVRLLLRARANPLVDNGVGAHPLEDAVLQGHTHVSQLLVAASADLFRYAASADRRHSKDEKAHLNNHLVTGTFSWADGSVTQNEPGRLIDEVFASQNPALMAAVAAGLKDAPNLIEQMQIKDLVHFLSCPGEAPLHILSAIFRPSSIIYWEMQGRKMRRVRRQAAFVGQKLMNVAQGPHSCHVVKHFNTKEIVSQELLDFFDELAPTTPIQRGSSMYVPTIYYMCHVPMVHQDLNFIRAVAECPEQEVFRDPGCQAIVNLKWRSVRPWVWVQQVVVLLEVLNLHWLSYLLSNAQNLVRVSSVMVLCLVLASLVLEVAQSIGYITCGLTRRCLQDPGSWMRKLILCMLLTVSAIVLFDRNIDDNKPPPTTFKVLLGSCILMKWLDNFRAWGSFELVGLRILPISITMQEAVPFCVVLVVVSLATSGFYYALGIHDFMDCFFILYRIYALGDVQMPEMENQFDFHIRLPSFSDWRSKNNTEMRLLEPEDSDLSLVVRGMFLVLSFIVGVSLMNLYVAMVCRSYVQAADVAWLDFMRCRASVVLDQHALRLGLASLCCRRRSAYGGQNTSQISSKSLNSRFNKEAKTAYVWFAVPRELTPHDQQEEEVVHLKPQPSAETKPVLGTSSTMSRLTTTRVKQARTTMRFQ